MGGQKVKLSTRTDLKNGPTAKVAVCDVETAKTFGDFKVTTVVQPILPTLSIDGINKPKGEALGHMDVIVESGNVYCYFDNIDMGTFASPRVTAKHKLSAGGNTYGLEATYARKGNTSVLPKLAPLQTDILKLACTMPKVSGVGSKLEFGTLTKVATANLDKAVGDAKCKLKVDYDTKKQSAAWKAVVAYPLPEGVGLTADLSNKMSGLLSLAKGSVALDLPYDTTSGPNVRGAALKFKWSTSVEV